MILHIAAFDLVEGVTAEQVAGLTGALEAMAASLPQLRFYACGENLRLRAGGSDFGVVAVVDDREGLDAYLDGDAHREVGREWLSWIVAGRHAVQLDLDAEALGPIVAAYQHETR